MRPIVAALVLILASRSTLSTAATPGQDALAPATPSPSSNPSPENERARRWFQDAKFGMFIHWGVYSVPARGEWLMQNQSYSITEYEKFAPQFNPTRFDAAEIVALAKSAGMKYITVTSKHHDGFAMFATRQDPWNIVDATPYHRDPIRQLADEAHRQGVKLFFYYSQMDWHHPQYFPLGKYGHAGGRPNSGEFGRYLDFMDAQLKELLTNYGEIAGVWFDGMWDKPDADWRLQRTYGLIHALQPAALIGSNHHVQPFPGEDFQIFEKDLPGSNSAGFNKAQLTTLPLETCETINQSWGYTADDQKFKSAQEIIDYLVRTAGRNANLLLNIGPTGAGDVPAEVISRLHAVGEWMSRYGDAIYGTREGPISPRAWGVSTAKDDKVYLHVLDWRERHLVLPNVPGIKSARYMDDGRRVNFRRVGDEMLMELPGTADASIDRIIVLQR